MVHEALLIPGEGMFLLPKALVGFREEIISRLERYPYDRNVFLMLRFRDTNADLSTFIVESLNHHGLKGIRADDSEWNITNNVYNPIAALYCCKYGIALFDEPEEGQTFNPNVVYELGIMQSQRKNCLILKHRSLPQVPFDLIKDLHRVYGRDLEVRKAIGQWVAEVSTLIRTDPIGKPRIALIDENSLVLGASGQANLEARAVKLVPRLGAIDLVDFFADAKRSIDFGFPLSRTSLPLAVVVLRDFMREREGVARFVFVDPEAAFVRDRSLQEGLPAGAPGIFAHDYAADFEELSESFKSLVGWAPTERVPGATVKLYLHRIATGYSLFRSDDRMIVCPWNDGLEPEESPCLVLERGDEPRGFFASYLSAFEDTIRRRSARLVLTNKLLEGRSGLGS